MTTYAVTSRIGMIVAVLLAFPAQSIAQVGTLAGHAAIEGGHSIPLAHVVVHEDLTDKLRGSLEEDITLVTDGNGRFTLRLDEGLYDVCVMFHSLMPECRKVRIRAGRTTQMVVRLREVAVGLDDVVDASVEPD